MGTLAKLPEPQMSAWISAAFMRLSQSASVHESAPGVEAKCSHHRTVASGHSMPSGNCGCVIVVLANWITSNQCLGAAGATRASGTGGTREIKLALHVSRTHDNHLHRENQEPEEREPPREKALRVRPATLRTALPARWNRLRTIHLLSSNDVDKKNRDLPFPACTAVSVPFVVEPLVERQVSACLGVLP